jgi:RNA polymerase sigma factor (sigma-70 family)
MSPELPAVESGFEPEKLLRPHEQDMLRAIQDARQAGISATYIEAATGCGKDFTIARDIKGFLEENPEDRVLYLCHSGAILDQASQEIAAVTGSTSHGRMFGGEYQDQEQIVFATFQTLGRPLGGGFVYEAFDPKEFKYIVVNESHHGPAPTYRPVIEYFDPDFLLGATATPDRRDEQDIKEIFGEPIYRLPLEEAIAKGYLARPNYHVLTDQLRHLEQSELNQKDIEQINGMVFVPKRDQEIVEIIGKHLETIDDPRTLVFCPSIDHADYFSDLFPGESAALHSGIDDDEQDQILKAFRDGTISTLMVVDMLNEGVHVPQVNAVVFLRSTESKTVFFQQLGRGLGKIDGKDEVLVLDFVASWNRLSTLGDLQAGIKRHRSGGPRGSRQNWEIDTDISFNFSTEALEAVQVIQDARIRERRNRQLAQEKPRLTKAEIEEAELKAMLGVERLPQQRIRPDEWQRYEARIASGNEAAMAELVSRRLFRAYSAAKTHAEKEDSAELTVEDYFQYAIEGMYMGLDRYLNGGGSAHGRDLSKDISSGMAGNLSRKSKERGLVRIPIHKIDAIGKLEKKRQKIASQIDPNDPGYRRLFEDEWELAERTNMDPEQIHELDFIQHVVQYENHLPIVAAGNMASEEEVDPTDTPTFREVGDKLQREALEKALEGLTYRERRVMELRFGLAETHVPTTLDEVGNLFNINRERVRQIEHKSIKAMREGPQAATYNEVRPKNLRSDRLKELLDPFTRLKAEVAIRVPSTNKKYLASMAILALHYLDRETSSYGQIPNARFIGGAISYMEKQTQMRGFRTSHAQAAIQLLRKAGLLSYTWDKMPGPKGSVTEYVSIHDSGRRRVRH